MMELSHLSVAFGPALALRDVSLSIARGERVGIVGESGSGKSMLGLAMMGMVPDSARVAGGIDLDGAPLATASERNWRRVRARKVAMIFQEPMAALNPLQRLGETVMEPLQVHLGLGRAAARRRTLELFDEVGIPEPEARLRQYPHEISGGQRQRVLIALALTCDPALLIADEPTTALDAHVALRIIDLLVNLAANRQMALVFISHDLAAVARATERIAVMYGGEIVETGPTAAVLNDPHHPYTRGLLGARPGIGGETPGRGADGRRQRLPTIPGTVPSLSQLPEGCRFAGRCPLEIPICASQRPTPRRLPGGRHAACHLLEPVA